MKKLYKNLIFALASVFSFSALAQPSSIEVKNLVGKALNKNTASRSAAGFVKNKELVLNWNGVQWDTTAQNLYSYAASGLLEQLINQSYVAGTFNNNSREFYMYNSINNGQTLYEYSIWADSSSSWVAQTKDTTVFDAQGNPTLNMSLALNTGTNTWDTISANRTTYTYSGSNIASQVNESYSGGVWTNQDKQIFTYNASNEPTEILFQTWNAGTSTFDDTYKVKITWYDFEQDEMLTATLQIWAGFMFVDFYKLTDTYNSDGNRTSTTTQQFNTSTFSYDNVSQTTFTYNGLLLAQEVSNNWDAGTSSWIPASRTSYTYDAKENITEQYTEDYDGTSWAGTSGERHTYTYDVDGNISVDEVHFYDSFVSSWEPTVMYIYDYDFITAVNNELAINTLSLYPNPAQDQLTINLGNKNISSISVFDVAGKLVFSETNIGGSKFDVNLNSLNSGVYFIKINSDSEVITSKFMKN